ncbi:hypothetical protein KUW09_05185 [Mameliella alba]|nr:hypothetical protein [Antarctobacter heliothermus]MBY6143423.1 hypothetical protein [Mameliella alba]MCA0952853.1 hypothetical protein [Mameliella alba]
MAAHLEGNGGGLIDMAGLAQKGGAVTTHIRLARDPPQIKADRVRRLTAYQDAEYAGLYQSFGLKVSQQDTGAGQPIALAVAGILYKVMAHKDEYEVARLIPDGAFNAHLAETFEGAPRLTSHLAMPFLPGRDPATGRPRKGAFGAWVRPLLRGMARLKHLRGTWADPFGRTAERREERRLIRDSMAMLDKGLARLPPETCDRVLALAEWPDSIRGYGPVKLAAVEKTDAERTRLLAALESTAGSARHAA